MTRRVFALACVAVVIVVVMVACAPLPGEEMVVHRTAVRFDIMAGGWRSSVTRFVDAEAGVACWSDSHGISCLPLSQTRLAQAEVER